MQYQGIEEQRVVNNGLLPIARDLEMPLVVTNDVHYLHQHDSKPHDLLLCIGTGKSVHDEKRLKYHGDQFFLKTAGADGDRLRRLPRGDAEHARHRRALQRRHPLGHAARAELRGAGRLHARRLLRTRRRARASRNGCRACSSWPPRTSCGIRSTNIRPRLDYEIAMIKRMGYTGYFMIVWDFIRYAREQGIPVGPGRGSAAGSLVAYCLRITDVDPIDYDLLFERFLNPERVSMPDIDVDFCERRRGEVIEYVTRKYGRENVSQIITFGTMKAKAVIRDVGRVLDMAYADVDRIAKQIPPALDMTLEKALAENPGAARHARQGSARQGRPRHGQAPRGDVAQRRRARRRRRHRAGADHRLRAALQEQPRRNHDPVGDEGGRARRPPQDGLPGPEHAHAHPGRAGRDQAHRRASCSTSTRSPLDDAKTYQVFCEGQTFGIFQFESSGMRELLRKSKPQRLDDLIALNALYRPGPLKSGMVDDYVARKQGKTEVKYDLAALEPILADTYGVIAYQEQVMRIAAVLAGFTLGQSDVLRKAMGKKDPKVMAKQREAFLEGTQEEGHQREEGHQDLRVDGVLRRLRLQQVALDGLRVPGLSDRLSQGQLPAPLRGGAADHRGRQHRQAGALHRRVPRPRHRRAAARRQREPAALLGRAGRRALRPDRHQGARRRRHSGDHRRPHAHRPHHLAAPARRRARPAHRQPPRLRGAREGRRVRWAGRRGRAGREAGRRPRPPDARRRSGARTRRPRAARSRAGPGESLRRGRADHARRHPRRAGGRTRHGPRWSGWPTRRKRSGST